MEQELTINSKEGRRIEIVGKRLILREINPSDDLSKLLIWRNSVEYQEKLLSYQFSVTLEEFLDETRRRYNNDLYAQFIVWDKEHNIAIGTNWIYRYNAKNSYAYTTTYVAPEFRTQSGYGVEMFLLACKYMFENLRCRKVYNEIHGDNVESLKIFNKLKLLQEACFKGHTLLSNGEYIDLYVYAIYKEDFEKRPIVKRILI